MPTPLVADAIAYYEELLAADHPPATWWENHVSEVQRHWHAEAPLDAYVLRPLFIDEQTYATSQASLQTVMQAFDAATARLASDEALRRTLGLPAYLEPLLELDRVHGRQTCLGRLDGFMATDGTLTLIEFNSEPQSAPLQYELERSFERLPISTAFGKRFKFRSINLYDQVLATLRERGTDGQLPTIAVIDKYLWRSRRRAGQLRPLMYSSARGCPVLYVDPEELDYKNGKLRFGDIPIDMVAFVNWQLLINERKRLMKILRAVAERNVQVFAGISRGLLASYKVVFELLSSSAYRDMFSPEMCDALDRHVPWTRLLRERTTDHAGTTVDLLPFVAANRERLVIKPAGGGGGTNITIGREVSDDEWTATIKSGAAQNWIVQAVATVERQRFPVATKRGELSTHELNCEYSPYVWNGTRIDGVLCRVVRGSVISDSGDREVGIGNGVETATWIIDRR
jgi:hypothetical protein